MTPVDRLAFELADPERFRSYLRAKRADDFVGSSHSGCHCPVAKYLRTFEVVSPASILAVGNRGFWVDDDPLCPIPEWASRFIKTLDARFLGYTGIRAEEALRVLDHVLEEMAS